MQILQIFQVTKNFMGYLLQFYNNYRREQKLKELRLQLTNEAQALLNLINELGINNQQIREDVQEINQQLEKEKSTLTEEQLTQELVKAQELRNLILQYQNDNEELEFDTLQINVRIELKAPKHIKQIFQRYPANFQYSYQFNLLYKGTDEDRQRLNLIRLGRNNFNNLYLNKHIPLQELAQISRINHCIFYIKVNEEEQFSPSQQQRRVHLYLKTESPNGLELIRNNQTLQIKPNTEAILEENDKIEIIKEKISYVVQKIQYEILQR